MEKEKNKSCSFRAAPSISWCCLWQPISN